MRRLILPAACLLVVGGLASGCFDASPVLHPTGAQCGGATEADAATCEGSVCLGIKANAQGMTGVCSAVCGSDSDCTPHDHCLAIPNQGSFCFRACHADADCYDAFVCRPYPGDMHEYCLWDQ